MSINRRAVVKRHNIRLTSPDAQACLSVGNGDFAFNVDATGLQSFIAVHDPSLAVARAMEAGSGMAATLDSEPVLNTATMSTWGWHEMPNPKGYVLEDAMSEYQSSRGPVRYPDRYDMAAAMGGVISDEDQAGAWLHVNPQRIDLGRIGLEFRPEPHLAAETTPDVLEDLDQVLDLWTGTIDSRYAYRGVPVHVRTLSAPDSSTVAFRIESDLLADRRARVTIRFPYPSEEFFRTSDWTVPEKHGSALSLDQDGTARIRRTIDGTTYSLSLRVSGGSVETTDEAHTFAITALASTLTCVATFTPDDELDVPATFDEVQRRSAGAWHSFWTSGAAVDLEGSTDPRANELERRIVLSQYLTRVHCAGTTPPQETGLVTNSWQGKFHLEMHFWHAAHFAAWGRPELLVRSFDWYVSILDVARRTAAQQGYPGARWPKHVGPDGRESPSPIGSLLIWQQPHLLHLLELAWHASDDAARSDLVARYGELADETATFMAAYAEPRDGQFHLGPPVMPAQEFYDAATTADPTFELAYWWWGLEIAQRWRERQGAARSASWTQVQEQLTGPRVVDGRYAAVATSAELRRDDHPSLLFALGVVPRTPLIDPGIMEATLLDVLQDWEWPTSWGWDFPAMAMTAARLGRSDLTIDTLLLDQAKNRYGAVGHNPQMGAALPLYLPANGALLAAVSLLVSGAGDGTAPAIPSGWRIEAEGFPGWP